MKIKFKCKQSGNVFEFSNEHDIKTMRTHPEYEEIVEETVEHIEKKFAGRSKKQQIE